MKETRNELLKNIQKNLGVVNRSLNQLEKRGYTHSKAYQYVQNKLSNKKYTRTINGNVRFITKRDYEKLSYNDLKAFAHKLQDYRKTSSGTFTGQKKIERQAYKTFQQTIEENQADYDIKASDISFTDFQEIVKSQAFNDMKEKFASSTVFEFFGKVGLEQAMNVARNIDNISTIFELYEEAKQLNDIL